MPHGAVGGRVEPPGGMEHATLIEGTRGVERPSGFLALGGVARCPVRSSHHE